MWMRIIALIKRQVNVSIICFKKVVCEHMIDARMIVASGWLTGTLGLWAMWLGVFWL